MTTNTEHAKGLDRAMNPHLSSAELDVEDRARGAATSIGSTEYAIDASALADLGPWGQVAASVKRLLVPDVASYWPGVVYNREGHWMIRLAQDGVIERGRLYLQVGSFRVDTISGQRGWGYGGKAYLSEHMTDSEIVQTVFGLFKAFEEHECREAFMFAGRRVFGPHLDVWAVHSIAEKTDARQATS